MSAATHPLQLSRKLRPIASVIEYLLGLKRIASLYDRRPKNTDTSGFLSFLLENLGIQPHMIDEEKRFDRIPRKGPLLVVANHPLGGLEGMAITKLIMDIRPDIKVLANKWLTRIPEFRSVFIGVNVLSGNTSGENISALRRASRHLCGGGALLMFPSGKVASFNLRSKQIEEHTWNRLAGNLQRKSKAVCLPIYVDGVNSRLFYALGALHPRLRTIMLFREMINKKNRRLSLIIGEPILQMELRFLDSAKGITDYLRLSTEFLNLKHAKRKHPLKFEKLEFKEAPKPAAEAGQHLETLQEYRLISQEPFDLYCVPYEKLGPVMREIGIAREITFRAAGEGSGKPVDSDQFDPHYLHLFIWDCQAHRIVGGYRIGRAQEIADRHGMNALYTRTLFHFDRKYLNKMGPSLEMGRSFVFSNYQRHPKVLDLLWRGIGAYIARNPQFYILFGAVSISRTYSSMARALIAESMVEAFPAEKRFMQKVTPIVPLKVSAKPWSKEMLASLRSVTALNKLVGRCDPEKTLPTLLRHYLSLNGKFICFSVNKGFNDSLDGLIIVDIRKMPKHYLNRYLGREQARIFMDKWEIDGESSPERKK